MASLCLTDPHYEMIYWLPIGYVVENDVWLLMHVPRYVMWNDIMQKNHDVEVEPTIHMSWHGTHEPQRPIMKGHEMTRLSPTPTPTPAPHLLVLPIIYTHFRFP